MKVPQVKLSKILTLLSGFAFKSEFFNETEGTPLIRIRDISNGHSKTLYRGPYNQQYVVKNGEILIGMDGSFSVAKWSGGEALLNQRVCKIIPNLELVDKGYLFWYLPIILKNIETRTSFVTVKHLLVPDLLNEYIPLPPLPEQRRIAAILDQADALRAKRRESLAELDKLAQSIFIEMFGDPVTNPKNWNVGNVRQAISDGFIEEIQDGNHGELHPKSSDFIKEGIPFLMANCLVGGIPDLSKAYKLDPNWLKKLRVGFSKPNDLLISHKGTIGSVAIIPPSSPVSILSPQVTYYRTTNKYDVHFLAGYFKTPFFQALLNKEAKQSTRAYIGITRQLSLPLIFPPLDLQKVFADRVDRILKIQEKQKASEYELNALFSSLQNRAFRGEL